MPNRRGLLHLLVGVRCFLLLLFQKNEVPSKFPYEISHMHKCIMNLYQTHDIPPLVQFLDGENLAIVPYEIISIG
jgi:hypothetical protein